MAKTVEADWEFDVGGDAPVIDARWPGLVDLRAAPERIDELAEVHQLAGLASALLRLNHPEAHTRTTKCDVWSLTDFDQDELDATRVEGAFGIACYVDLLPQGNSAWKSPAPAEEWCRRVCAALHAIPLHCCRADLVIRGATEGADEESFGVSAYLSACGVTADDASAALSRALAAFVSAGALTV